jgi:predicted RNA polymerase sigma factor
VLAVVYLIFNEGWSGRNELAGEALALGRSLAELMPDEPEANGLLALMLLHDSRRDARVRDGEIVLLSEQDRALWDLAQIAAGRAALDRAIALRGHGPRCLSPRARARPQRRRAEAARAEAGGARSRPTAGIGSRKWNQVLRALTAVP